MLRESLSILYDEGAKQPIIDTDFQRSIWIMLGTAVSLDHWKAYELKLSNPSALVLLSFQLILRQENLINPKAYMNDWQLLTL